MNFHVNLRIYYYTALSASTKKLGAKIQTHPIVSVSRESLSMKKKTQYQSKSKISLIYHVKK